MASKVKEIHQYDGTQWGPAVPIGADASNVDVRTSDNTDVPLQSVLGSFNATEPSIKTQINGKVEKEGGDVAHAVINDPVNQIPIYDLDTAETSEKLISDDISTDTDMVVMSGDGENLTTMWGKFNRFRKRVDNKFKNYLVTSLEGVAPGASSDTKGYSTQALNNYFNDVIGYTSAASVAQTGSVASQLSSLNSNMNFLMPRLATNEGYFALNNPAYNSIQPNTSFSTGYAGLQYSNEYSTNPFVHIYKSGGIRNKLNKTLYIFIMYHIPIQRASSASGSTSWVYFNVRRHDSSSSTYESYRYLGTQLFVPNVNVLYMTGSAYVPIQPLGYMAIFIGTDKGTVTSSTSGRLEIQPIGLAG